MGMQAISLLDRPWEAAVEHAEAMNVYKRERRRNPQLDPPPRQHGSAFHAQWLPGERRVRQILLGHPDSVTLAAMPPSWLRCGARGLLQPSPFSSAQCLPPPARQPACVCEGPARGLFHAVSCKHLSYRNTL